MDKFSHFVSNNKKYITKVGIDFFSIIVLGIPVLVLFIVGKPYERGFNCDDESIRYPYKENTISSGLNYGYSTSIPIITIFVVELVYYLRKSRNAGINRRNSQILSENTNETTKSELFWILYCRLSPFIFGALISQMTTDIAKYSIGRLRPHFIDVCNPRESKKGIIFTLENPEVCESSGLDIKYITDFVCTNAQYEHRWKDSRLSFMSGHSSFASYCLIYLVIYLQVRLKCSTIGFIRPLYQAILIYIVIYTGFSRISDYKHHWSDVMIGLIQGTTVAILTTYFISDLFNNNSNNSNEDHKIGAQSSQQNNYNSCVELDESNTPSKAIHKQ